MKCYHKKIIIIALLLFAVFTGVFYNIKSTANSIDTFQIDFSNMEYNYEVVYSKYTPVYHRKALIKLTFHNTKKEEIIRRIQTSSIQYITAEPEKTYDIPRECLNNESTLYLGVLPVNFGVKSWSEHLAIIINDIDCGNEVYLYYSY